MTRTRTAAGQSSRIGTRKISFVAMEKFLDLDCSCSCASYPRPGLFQVKWPSPDIFEITVQALVYLNHSPSPGVFEITALALVYLKSQPSPGVFEITALALVYLKSQS